MILKPLHDWVVVSRNKVISERFWLPEQVSNKGEVIAIGPKVVELSVGDKIQFNPYAGLEVSMQGETFLFINELEVIFIR
ncbi:MULTISPECIES: co-chaperone GroES [unclassified Vibrio]|uniref:co-chaperone GroES n=1 Tax=unclassified Vibrio TaxID=2614977 RepID=UPI001EFD4E45|nr:co-chaperone GroES [Vibrio sp. Isolate25]MCG9597078.1 co-chaperone GroES [Vibrio sp. Isolate25]